MSALFLLTPALILPAMLLRERFERYALRGGDAIAPGDERPDRLAEYRRLSPADSKRLNAAAKSR